MNRKFIAFLADQHAGSRLGLMAPDVELQDAEGQPWQPSPGPVQQWLWECYEDAILRTLELINGAPLILVHVGDLCQGDRHGPFVSPLVADQAAIAVANIMPWLELAKVERLYLLSGTEVHDYGGGSAERLAGAALAGHTDVRYCAHLLLNVGQDRIDVAHHGPHQGSRKWLEGNSARLYLRDRMMGEIGRGQAPPAMYVRAHRHHPIDETIRMYGYQSRLLIIPSWQAAGQYVRNIAQSIPHICCGMSVVEIGAGRIVDVHQIVYELDIRTEDAIED